jgi:hypothetical protein
VETSQPAKKWSLRHAAFFGLVWQVIGTVASGDWPRIKGYLTSGNFEPTLMAVIELAATPFLFVIIAGIRNLLVRRAAIRRARRT